MIKQWLHKVFSISMALLVLFSTISFTVEKHYCGDFLIDTAVFSQVKKCDVEMANDEGAIVVKKKHCCKDEIEVVQGQDDLKITSLDDLDFPYQLFITSYYYTFIGLFESLPKQIIPHKDYSPPNLVTDIQVLDQVFTI